MGQPKLPEGLVWRKRSDGTYFKHIYFKVQHRKRRIRGSSGTNNREEAQRRLRRIKEQIDNQELYGIRPDRPFRFAAEKLIREFQGSSRTLRMYARSADELDPWIGEDPLRLICKDRLMPFIESRREDGVAVRTINLTLEFVRRVLRKAAYYWRDEHGLSWLENCPIIQLEKGTSKMPYPLSWDEQEKLFDLLPGRVRKAAIVAVNTGLRESPLIRLRWEWEHYEDELDETVFRLPGEIMKNKKPMVLILNRPAREAIESMRGYHPKLVFGEMYQMTNNSWQTAWRDAGLPTGKEYVKGVHNLRHTFGKRLRDADVQERDVQDLLHHVPRTITRHYSVPEMRKLKACLDRIAERPKGRTVRHGTKMPQAVGSEESAVS
jgi:integrase